MNIIDLDDSLRKCFFSCGYFAPGIPLPFDVLLEVLRTDQASLLDNLSRLNELGLLDLSEKGYLINVQMSDYARLLDKQADRSIMPDVISAWEIYLTLSGQLNYSSLDEAGCLHLLTAANLAEEARLEAAGLFWYALAKQAQNKGDTFWARQCYYHALHANRISFGPGNVREGIVLDNLGILFHQQWNDHEAEVCFRRALSIYSHYFGAEHPLAQTVSMRLEELQLTISI